jgi:ABC-2 type transport system ATP-binding protein
MLTTLLPIDAGTATVAGFDVARQPQQVRTRIGYVSQLGGADEMATGRENLLLQGRLYGASRAQVAPRAEALAELLDLAEFADRRVSTYSGGQRRRLDIALGIVHEPAVLFLDEPTTGLTRRAAPTCGTTSARCATAARRCSSPPTISRRPTSCATG